MDFYGTDRNRGENYSKTIFVLMIYAEEGGSVKLYPFDSA